MTYTQAKVFVVLCPPLRWKRASYTLKKMSEPFRLLSKCIPLPSLPMTSSKQPTPRGETSSSSSLKHWKDRKLSWSHTSPTSEGKSLLTTNRTLSRPSLLLLVLLPWRHLPLLKKNQCQVHGSHTIELHTHTHTMHEALYSVHGSCHPLHVLGASVSWSLVPVVHTHHAHKPHGAGVPTLCTYHMPRPDGWHCTVHGSCIVTIGDEETSICAYAYLHSTSLSTGPTLVSATGSSSTDSSHSSHLAEGKCAHVQEAPRWTPTQLGPTEGWYLM